MTAGTATSKSSVTASLPGPTSALSACSPAALLPWGGSDTTAPPRTAPTPASSARPVNQKAAAPADIKPRSSGLQSNSKFFPTATGIYHAPPAVALFQQQLAPAQCPVPGCHPGHAPCGMTVKRSHSSHRRCGSRTRRTGKVSIHNITLRETAVSCRRTRTVATTRCTKTAASRKRPAWRTPGGKSTTCMPARRPT